VNFLVSEDDSGLRGVFDSEFGLAIFACNTADGSGKMLAGEGFDVFDFEGFDVEIVLWYISM